MIIKHSRQQLVKVKILNTIGETVYIESLEGFIGRYEREINLEDYFTLENLRQFKLQYASII